MDIMEWRRKIDEIDRRLVDLLNERARCAWELGRIKKRLGLPIYDPAREEEIFQNTEEANRGPLSREAMRRLFERILDESRRIEKEG